MSRHGNQYRLDLGGDAGARAFADLDPFTQGYVTAMFWTGDEDQGIDEKGFTDLAPETLDTIIKECRKFQAENESALKVACQGGQWARRGRNAYDMESAGIDFWLTRNGHGAGYWDRDLIAGSGDQLTKAADRYATRDLYLGDDKKLYFL